MARLGAGHGLSDKGASRAQVAVASARERLPFVAAGHAGSTIDARVPRGPTARDERLRARVVLKRLPPVMKDRLPILLPGLFGFLGIDLVRVQRPISGTSLTLVLNSDDKVTAFLRSHKEEALIGTFESGGEPVSGLAARSQEVVAHASDPPMACLGLSSFAPDWRTFP